jgi:DNA-binding response OmpR family regulator
VRSLIRTIAAVYRRKIGIAVAPSPSLEGPSSVGPIAVVGLVTNREDRQLLDGICEGNRWRLFFAETCEEAKSALDRLNAPVILYDRDLPGKGWRETVEELAASPARACVILLSTVLDTYLRDEVLRNGGYDVLCKPLQEADVVRAVRLASWYWYSGARALSDLIQES